MKNWLIRVLGGITTTEFAEVFALAAKDCEVMTAGNDFLKTQCDARQKRIDYLENLILTKVGYIVPEGLIPEPTKDYQPIGGNNTWGKVKYNLEMADRKLMQEKLKNARH